MAFTAHPLSAEGVVRVLEVVQRTVGCAFGFAGTWRGAVSCQSCASV